MPSTGLWQHVLTVECQCLLAGAFSHQFSTSWSPKSFWKLQFQKPLLVTRAPSACSCLRLPVCACLWNAPFQVTTNCWNFYRIHNDSFDLQMLGKNRCWSCPLSTTWKSVSPINTFSFLLYQGFLWESFSQTKRNLEFLDFFSFQVFTLSKVGELYLPKYYLGYISSPSFFCF